MNITISPTAEFHLIADGVPCRAWSGVSEGGVRVTVYVLAVRVEGGQDEAALLAEMGAAPLLEIAVPLDPERN